MNISSLFCASFLAAKCNCRKRAYPLFYSTTFRRAVIRGAATNCGVLFLLYKLWVAREKAGTECGGIYKEWWEIIPPFKAIAFRVVVSATTQCVATIVHYVVVVDFSVVWHWKAAYGVMVSSITRHSRGKFKKALSLSLFHGRRWLTPAETVTDLRLVYYICIICWNKSSKWQRSFETTECFVQVCFSSRK